MEDPFARSILAHAPMAVVAIDESGVVRTANATAEAFFGGSLTGPRALAINELFEDLRLDGGTNERATAAFDLHGRTGGPGARMQARRLDGSIVPVDVQAARYSAAGEAFVSLFIQDVTALMAAESAVQALRVQITGNCRLNSLGEMASMLAHELNQPLSAVANHIHGARVLLAQSSMDTDAVQHSLDAAEAQAHRAGDVIRHLRALVSRDTRFHKAESVSGVMGEIMPILNVMARELDADLTLDVDPADQVDCDRVQLQQLVVNLVRNAMEAPETETRRQVRISGRRIKTAGYRCSVEDNGPGIAPHIRDRLFDPLVSTKQNGMGLGLSICRTIVEAHGGKIECCPSALGGAAFAFTMNDPSVATS